ncbi:hypothetical protein H9L14_14680 [Sphingomonas sediminicola]|jgi:hypothetical protein|uniref:Uncharacterized protein n=1 Tax=Sphingomonas sediminicola TaxID=386874 RepID=A0ABX6T8L3_9SPHN|nr:hypothetical protein [Sphingomonas sediminicola]QNP45734.1 hypothetical protein H9L14_14680 [Sphingomonas sediminicola]
MKTMVLAALGAASIAFASAPATAKQYVDYTPQKGYWDVNAVEVDPNHVDDYLTGLSKSLIPTYETLKKRGLIDDYKFMVRSGYVKGSPNVLLMTHSKSYGVLDADQARDQAIDKEIEALFTKEQNDAAIAGYEKYRTFIDNAQWTDIVMKK